MGSHFSIDVSELHMFASYGWLDLTTPCNHACTHGSIKVVGWGPTVATYELEECCECGCRAWRDGRWAQERQRQNGDSGFWNGRMDWRLTAAPTDAEGGPRG